jgi:hypothetical protein
MLGLYGDLLGMVSAGTNNWTISILKITEILDIFSKPKITMNTEF